MKAKSMSSQPHRNLCADGRPESRRKIQASVNLVVAMRDHRYLGRSIEVVVAVFRLPARATRARLVSFANTCEPPSVKGRDTAKLDTEANVIYHL